MTRPLILAAATIFLGFCAFATQGSPGGTTGIRQIRETVASALAYDSYGSLPPSVATSVSELGDAAAIGVIEHLGDRKKRISDDPSTPEEIRRILRLVRTAFANPSAIQPEENRSPKATLVLLQYLRSLPSSYIAREDLEKTGSTIEGIKFYGHREYGHNR
jgi:hypothetical protein